MLFALKHQTSALLGISSKVLVVGSNLEGANFPAQAVAQLCTPLRVDAADPTFGCCSRRLDPDKRAPPEGGPALISRYAAVKPIPLSSANSSRE